MSSSGSGDEEEEEYEVEQVLDRKYKKKEVLYLIRWKNYSAEFDTWEPQEHLVGCEELIAEFNRKKTEEEDAEREQEREARKIRKEKERQDRKSKESESKSQQRKRILVVSDDEEEIVNKKKSKDAKKKQTADEDNSLTGDALDDFDDWQIVDEVEEGELPDDKAKKKASNKSDEKHKKVDHDDIFASEPVLNLPPLSKTPIDTVKPISPTPKDTEEEGDDEDIDFESGLCVIEDFDAENRSSTTASVTEPLVPPSLIPSQAKKPRQRHLVDLPEGLTLKGPSKKKRPSPVQTSTSKFAKDPTPPTLSSKEADKKQRRLTTDKDTVTSALDALPRIDSLKESSERWVEAVRNTVIEASINDLTKAVSAGNSMLVAKILMHEKCPDINANDISLLMVAAKKDFGDICGMLVRKGADVNHQNNFGHTALMYAVESGNITSATILIHSGAYLNVTNIKGETALIRSVKRGQKACVVLLIQSGANFSAMSSTSKSALAIAQKMELTDIQSLLVNFSDYVSTLFEKKVERCLMNQATILDRFFPLHILSLCEAEQFHINFYASVPPVKKGEGNLLFMANAAFRGGEVRCIMSGECFVEAAFVNDVEQQSLSSKGHFILSLAPLHDGENKLIINTNAVPCYHKTKLLVRGFRVKLSEEALKL